MEVQSEILKAIKRKKRGEVFFPSEFRSVGNEHAVNMALSRLAKEGIIERIAKGIYVLPKIDRVLGKVPPSLEAVAAAIAKRDHVRIRPSGDFALHKLGLSTQIPLRLVYVTDGAPRTIQIGNRSIVFRPTTPKKLSTKGKISSLVIQGLEALGQKNVTPEIKHKIESLLTKEEPKAIHEDALIAPSWISNILLTNTGKN